ncbi:hypothetical protein P152DRAFT_156799 [Eremomyces bilateralis CBS 781.70]|uniref:Uncharacterized protein n=1 Tax=Eremomyces bilateralis CBS 781.70 TaxID=1392243 RepID=A0A6G1FVF3_9PEZI|nr:uncharacterized protein P152DRAFT_156799 [Eremomyces bilateralis CBS 781.70]KAF1809688.1 hypothetical protein P152DRAFT_156799 [Eremomyces bilateralis CBS 781.70]
MLTRTEPSPVSPMFCPTGRTWSQMGTYGRCCTTTARNCEMPTGCLSTSLLLGESDTTITCTSTDAPVCIADLVYDDFSDATPVVWAGCDMPRSAVTLYRTNPGASSSSTTRDTTTSDSSTSGQTTSSSSTSSRLTPTLLPSDGDNGGDGTGVVKKKKGGNGWIAGAVIGPIAGLALIGALIFYLLRKKKSPPPAAAAAAAAQQQPLNMPPPDMSHQYPGHMSMVGSPPPQYQTGFDPSKGPVAGAVPVGAPMDSSQQYAYPQGQPGQYPPQQGQEYKGYYPPQGQPQVAGVPHPGPPQSPQPQAPPQQQAPAAELQ